MADTPEKPSRYAELVGLKLRRLRQERRFSLQDVCDRSGSSFVVSTLSAYEHGKRSLSLERLVELANIYGVSLSTLLEVEDRPEGSLADSRPLRIDLQVLKGLPEEERSSLDLYLEFLRTVRQDPTTDIMTIRRDDLNYLASLYAVRPQILRERLMAAKVLAYEPE
jgi:transcriptional regulator with XRE-family HTH domain